MQAGSRRKPTHESRCCICSGAIDETPAYLLVYWPERDAPIPLEAHPHCLERTPLLRELAASRGE
jgi:galactose-1-phosphate uridylyltransferase